MLIIFINTSLQGLTVGETEASSYVWEEGAGSSKQESRCFIHATGCSSDLWRVTYALSFHTKGRCFCHLLPYFNHQQDLPLWLWIARCWEVRETL